MAPGSVSLASSAGDSDDESSKSCIVQTNISGGELYAHGELPDRTVAAITATESHDQRSDSNSRLAKLLQGKEKEWAAVAEKQGPLQLLDLPVDILKEIVKEITHTNDLTSLALTHSALHRLAIPHIYSRFDIVWPDAHATSDNRTGVDALTYGLATLVMGEDVFGPIPPSTQFSYQPPLKRQRRGNYFAQFTRKFSLGNGPSDWIQEYLISKEGGKMLGTLVALAVARMHNLTHFQWDMPSGVLRDVWIALASLGDRHALGECPLEKVWVRWHDNSDTVPTSPVNGTTTVPTMLPSITLPAGGTSLNASLFHIPPYPRVEFPTLSILPPLKSLTVLDIDELSYVEEMSVLIERSMARLQELRVGIAQHAESQPWVRLPEGRPTTFEHVAGPGCKPLSRAGGLLGIIISRICDVDNNALASVSHSRELAAQLPSAVENEAKSIPVDSAQQAGSGLDNHHPSTPQTVLSLGNDQDSSNSNELDSTPAPGVEPASENAAWVEPSQCLEPPLNTDPITPGPAKQRHDDSISASLSRPFDAPEEVKVSESAPTTYRNSKLTLDVLELERVPLSIPVLLKAIDWTRLTTLTILRCQHHEQLWKALRKRFTPPAISRSSSSFKTAPGPFGGLLDKRRSSTSKVMVNSEEYPLKIRRFQTDAVSASLISFIKDTLAPDSLEWLFLQEGRPYVSGVSLDAIYRGAIRRHRGSLRKLLIDSEDRADDGQPAANHRWRKWAFNREVLTFVTSGRMPKLRELGMAIEYKDWHFFLQRLPDMQQLRSIYIPYVADHVHGRNLDSRELALQILDIVALRPELEICYLGIQSKCFEILELRSSESQALLPDVPVQGHAATVDSDLDSEDDPDGDDDPTIGASNNPDGLIDAESETSSAHVDTDDDDDIYGTDCQKSTVQFRLREILFYDDKVSIFKARHGKL